MFGSKLFLTMLYRLGFSVSYDEVTRYRQSVAQTEGTGLPEKSPMSFTQWSADNVDHNVATLDGLGTFHGMGIISMSVHDNIIRWSSYCQRQFWRGDCAKVFES
jgi:hypothetical protein